MKIRGERGGRVSDDDVQWVERALTVASQSKNPRYKVGAVYVYKTWSRDGGDILTSKPTWQEGYNRCVLKDTDDKHDPAVSDYWVSHAEEDCLVGTGRHTPPGGTMYMNRFPCARCVRLIIRCSVGRLVTLAPDDEAGDKYRSSWEQATIMLATAGITVDYWKFKIERD